MSNLLASPSSSPLLGTIGSDWYATQLAARMADFFFEDAPWHRRLWDAGTVLALKEFMNASWWRSQGVLSEGSVRWLAHELERIAGSDFGVGDRPLKALLAAELRSTARPGTRHWRSLDELIRRIEDGYLDRWRVAVRTGLASSADRVARAFAAQLLDRGYSLPFLHSWVTSHLSGHSTLGEMLESAQDLDEEESCRTYEVLLPFIAVPGKTSAGQPNWLEAPAVKSWLNAHGGRRSGQPGTRYDGAFSYTISAMDPYAAARIATGIRDRLLARASYAPRSSRMRAVNVAWIHDTASTGQAAGGVSTYDLGPLRRGAYARSLIKANKVHDVGVESTALDDALELAANLNTTSSQGAAIASGWSALEALLFSPADPEDSKEGRGVVACDRAAALVTGSWPRAVLTPLAYAHLETNAGTERAVNLHGELAAGLDLRHGGPPHPAETQLLSDLLAYAEGNRERCQIIVSSYRSGVRLALAEPADIAAQESMLALIDNPRVILAKVRNHLRHTFRRMYRQRNIVVHGGVAGGPALDVALRTAAPLVGAALDRVAQAQLVDGVTPLALASRAELNLQLLGKPGGTVLAELLE